MGEIRYCPECHNVQASGQFCSKCGYDLSTVKERPLIENVKPVEIVSEDNIRVPANDYRTLRFVAEFFMFMGWLAIIATVIMVCLILSSATGIGAAFSLESGSPFGNLLGMSGAILAGILLFVGIGAGLGEIAAGQLIMVFLDIRDDVRKIASKKA